MLFAGSADGLAMRRRLEVPDWADCDIARLDDWAVARPRGLKNRWKVDKVGYGQRKASFLVNNEMKMTKAHLGRPGGCRNAASLVLLTRTV